MIDEEYTLDENTQIVPTKIMVIGVGGGGSNAVSYMHAQGIEHVELVALNTDVSHLSSLKIPTKQQIGSRIVGGKGVGGKPEIGAKSAEDSLEQVIAPLLEGVDMLFLAAGMGGGTGTGATPVIAEYAKSKGILTVGVVTTPFRFEMGRRTELAEQGIKKLKPHVDALITIHNQNVLLIDKNITMGTVFSEVNKVLYRAVSGISDLITKPFTINSDFNDVKTILQDSGMAVMSYCPPWSIEDISGAINQVINNPLLENASLKTAERLLLNISVPESMGFVLIDELAFKVREEFSVDDDIELITGISIDNTLKNQFAITVVATTSKNAESKPKVVAPPPTKTKEPVENAFTNEAAMTLDDSQKADDSIVEFKATLPKKQPIHQQDDMLQDVLDFLKKK